MADKIDLRLDVGFPTHPKTIDLIGELGLAAAWGLLKLWCHCRQYRPDGDLTGKSDTYIEGAAGWPIERRGEFVAALIAVRYLDGEPGARVLHDWTDHQRWALGSGERQRNSRIAALIKHGRTRIEAENILKREEKTLVRSAVPKAVQTASGSHANRSAKTSFSESPASVSVTASEAVPDTASEPDAVAAEAAQSNNLSGAASLSPAPAKKRRKPPSLNGTANGHEPPPGSLVWNAYATAYETRYKTAPVRNAKTNSLCATAVQRLGATEAPEVVAFYVKHPLAFYFQRGHALDLFVRDAEKLRTEWATDRRITQTEARQQDGTGAHQQLIDDLKEHYAHGK